MKYFENYSKQNIFRRDKFFERICFSIMINNNNYYYHFSRNMKRNLVLNEKKNSIVLNIFITFTVDPQKLILENDF